MKDFFVGLLILFVLTCLISGFTAIAIMTAIIMVILVALGALAWLTYELCKTTGELARGFWNWLHQL